MSLYKQLLLLVSGLFCMIFSINYVVSVKNTMEYLEVQSKIHAQDTATSLGLSLSPHLVAEATGFWTYLLPPKNAPFAVFKRCTKW